MGIIVQKKQQKRKTIIAFFERLQRHVACACLATNPSTAFSEPQAEILHSSSSSNTPPTNPPNPPVSPKPTTETTRLSATTLLLLLRLIATCELFHVFIATAIQSRYLYNLFQQLVLLAAELRNLVAVRLQIIIMWLDTHIAHTHTRAAQLPSHII